MHFLRKKCDENYGCTRHDKPWVKVGRVAAEVIIVKLNEPSTWAVGAES